MGLTSKIRDILGFSVILEEMQADRRSMRELIGEILRVSSLQAETSLRMTSALERMVGAYETDGSPPEGRHMTDAMEVVILEQADERWRGN